MRYVLDRLKFSQSFRLEVKDTATIDARGYVIPVYGNTPLWESDHICVAYISVGFCVAVRLLRQCEKPQSVGRQQVQTLTLFCIIT